MAGMLDGKIARRHRRRRRHRAGDRDRDGARRRQGGDQRHRRLARRRRPLGDPGRGDQAADRGERGGAAAISTNSVAEWSSAQKIVQAALDHFGGLDVVVNNAGVLRDQIFHRMTPRTG